MESRQPQHTTWSLKVRHETEAKSQKPSTETESTEPDHMHFLLCYVYCVFHNTE